MEENHSRKQNIIFTTFKNQSKDETSNSAVEKKNERFEMVYNELIALTEEDKEKCENPNCSDDRHNLSISSLENENMDVSETNFLSTSNMNGNTKAQKASIIECSASSKERNPIFNDFYFNRFRNPFYSTNTSNRLSWMNNINENILPYKNLAEKSKTGYVSTGSQNIDSFHDNIVTLSEVIHQQYDRDDNVETSSYKDGTLNKMEDINVFQQCSDECKVRNKIDEEITLISSNITIQSDTCNIFPVIEAGECSTPMQRINSIGDRRYQCQSLEYSPSSKDSGNRRSDEITISPSASCMIVKPANEVCGQTDADTSFPTRKPITKSKRVLRKPKSILNALKFKTQSKDAFFTLFIAELLRSTHPNMRFNISVCQKIEMFLWDIVYRIGDEAESLMALSDRKLFTPRVLKFAIKFCLEHIKNEADAATGKKTPWMA